MCTTVTPTLRTKSKLPSVSGRIAKKNKPEAFFHSNKVLRNKSFRSCTHFSHPSIPGIPLPPHAPHETIEDLAPNHDISLSTKLILLTS